MLQQQDLEVLVAVGTPRERDEVDEERDEMRQHEPEHEASSAPLITRRLPDQPPAWQA